MPSSPEARPAVERLALALAASLLFAPALAGAVWHGLAAPLGLTATPPGLPLTLAAEGVGAVGTLLAWWRGGLRAWLPAGGLALIGAAGLGGPSVASVPALGALGAVGALAAGGAPRLMAWAPASLDGWGRANPRRAALWALTALLVVGNMARVSTFMADPSRMDLSATPTDTFFTRHSCLSAYVHGAELALRGEPNLYLADHWPRVGGVDAPLPPDAAHIAPFSLDTYGYPPPFLLVPGAMLALSPHFATHRAIFFALSLASLLLGYGWLAAFAGGRAHRTALLLGPLLFAAPPVFITLQTGNAQILVAAAAVSSMVAFHRGRSSLGGLLLAFAALAKISPGLLGVLLLTQRRWRDVGWTALWALVLCGLTALVFGPEPFEAFVRYQLPRLSSGEALGFLDDRLDTVAMNLSPFGVPFKLAAMGIPVDAWAVGPRIGDAYTLLVMGIAAAVGLKPPATDHGRVCAWLALLTLAALRSPYAAPLVEVSAIWMLGLLWPAVRSRGAVALFVAGWLGVLIQPPAFPETWMVPVSMVNLLVLYGLLAWVLLRARDRVPRSTPETP
ncbi:MAG: DUF2029 domain-containing protein [Alphaproteobacteria bacterium]|nr:DUF2029 domain-containing protein [Alphaproteobacteria bacterium]MCB9791138.1 DUF2029 domain-containing protein [Alphaproteobacteria bacterium]